jgi:hypothetical protein
MNRFLSALYVALLSLTLGLSASMHAQGIITGTLSGTVVDPTGAVIPNASVTVVDLAKGTSFTATSQSDGNFRFQALPIGSYSLTISSASFAATKIPAVEIASGVSRDLGKQPLKAGASTDVTVEAVTTAQLDTTESQVSSTFDSEQLQSLPLGNGFDSVALLEPGVAPTHDLNFANTNGANFSSNGARGRSNNFELDGQSNNDNSISGPQVFFGNQDAIQQIEVIQSNFSAQYGRNSGTVVNYITKSGTNALHGSGFELYTDNWLSSYPNQDKNALLGYCLPGQTPAANNCNAILPLPRSVDNKFGGTLGGPILKDKLFFFGSAFFDHTRNGSSPFNSGQGVTPTPAGLTQLAADFPNNPAVSILQNYGPYGVTIGNPQPVLNSPYATTESVVLPGGGTANIPVAPVQRIAPSGNFTDEEVLGRLDWQPTSKDRIFLRYFYQTQLSLNNADGGAGGTFYNVPDTAHSVGADITHTFSPNWLNQVRYSFQQAKLDFQGGSFPGCTVNSFTQCPGNISFTGTDLGFGEATNLPQGRTVKVTQVQDNASFSKGRNTLLFGGEFDYQNSPNVFLPLYNGEGQFSGLNDFLQQNGTFYLATGNTVIPFTEKDYALYGQDNYKATNDLTLNIGLRWEFFGQATNELHNLTVARESNPATAIYNTSLPLSQRTVPTVANAYKNFEPRVGIAYNPSFDKKLVIRGGYAIGYDPQFYNIFLNAATVTPVATAAAFGCNGICLGTGNFTGAGLRATNLSNLPVGGNPAFSDQEYVPTNFHNPYTETYTFGIEHQITNRAVAKLSYVGTHSVGQFQSVDANPELNPVQQGYPSVAQAFPSAVPVSLCTNTSAPGYGRPNCNLSNLSYVQNTAFSIYNGLQSEMSFHDFHGFSGNVSYTFSHAIDNSSEVYSTGAGGNTIALPQNPLNNDLGERGTSGFSLPNVFTVGMVYKVPEFHHGNSLVRKALNGFQVNGIYQYNSGQAYNPYQPLLAFYNFGGGYALTPSYCDNTFNASTVGPQIDTCRLALTNKKAPLSSVAIVDGIPLLGLPTGSYEASSFVNYFLSGGGTATPTPLATSSAHWTINNANYANLVGNPYPGAGRNILRAQPFNNLDASIFKDIKVNERIALELQLDAYNTLNHQFRGTPAANAFDTNPGAPVNPFLSNAYNSSNNRYVQLGGKIKF